MVERGGKLENQEEMIEQKELLRECRDVIQTTAILFSGPLSSQKRRRDANEKAIKNGGTLAWCSDVVAKINKALK